jgi:hypothetical protein
MFSCFPYSQEALHQNLARKEAYHLLLISLSLMEALQRMDFMLKLRPFCCGGMSEFQVFINDREVSCSDKGHHCSNP